jgi:hypothetical protein
MTNEPPHEHPHSYPVTWSVVAASALAVSAGVLHFVLAPAHLAEARAQGIFFLALGIGQIGWGMAFLRNPTPHRYLAGVVVTFVMSASMYVLTRFVAAPFSEEAEAFDVIGVATLACETGGALVLIWHGLASAISWRSPNVGSITLALILVVAGLGLTGALYGIGVAVEPVAPWLGEGEEGEHNHAAAEESAHTDETTTGEPAEHVHVMALRTPGPGLQLPEIRF